MKKIKDLAFVTLGMVALGTSLTACQKYEHRDISYELSNTQQNVVLTLGDAFKTSLYNVKEPIDIVFKAPEDFKIIIANKEYDDYTVKINPQDPIHLNFAILENGKDKTESIESHVSTFKEQFKPVNRSKLITGSGKHKRHVGENIYYSLNNNPREAYVDLHEHNKMEENHFYYTNGTNDVLIRMVAPRYTSFVFENGKKTKEYAFNLKKGDNYYFSLKLSQDNVDHTYSRTYKFNRK